MRPDHSKILVGIEHLEAEIASNTNLLIALDLETTSLAVNKAKITWISWCTGERYGVVPILHRNFKTEVDGLLKFPTQSTSAVCDCEQGSNLTGVPGVHSRTFICQNSNAKRAREIIRDLHSRSDITVIWHNAAYDLSVLVKNQWLSLDDLATDRLEDTLLMSYLLNPVKSREGGEHGLKNLYDGHLRDPGELPQPNFEDITNGRAYTDISIDRAAFYAAFDAFTTFHLYKLIFKDELLRDPTLSRYYRSIELPHLLTTVELMTSGIRLLPQSELSSRGLATIAELERHLEQQKLKIFKLTGVTFNFDSPDALRRVLLFNCGIRSKDWNQKSDSAKIDATTLAKMYRREWSSKNQKIIAHVMYAKRLTEILKKHREMYNYVDQQTHREHAVFRPTTASGRYAASKPNLLSLPRATKIKEYLEAGVDRVFVIADFSQIDLRVIANETWERDSRSKMLESVNRGDDLHTSTLRIVYPNLKFPPDWVKLYENRDAGEFGVYRRTPAGILEKVPLSEGDRDLWLKVESARKDVAKQVNFGISYGLSDDGLLDALNNPKDFRDGLVSMAIDDPEDRLWLEYFTSYIPKVYTLDEVQSYLEKFHAAYSGIRQFQNLVEQELCEKGATYNLFGKLCRAEVARFMSSGLFDICVGYGKWYRVRVRILKMDSKAVYGVLLQANELEIVEPLRGAFDLTKLVRNKGYEIYRLDEAAFENVIRNYEQNRLVEPLLDGLDRIHKEANWAANAFLSSISPSEPHWDSTEIFHASSYPFMKLTHYQVKFVWDDTETRSFLYPTFSKLKRNLVSARIQSASMDFCKIAMFTFRDLAKKQWPKESERPRIVNCIHDEIAVECRSSQEDDVKRLLQLAMTDKANFQKYVATGRRLEVDIGAEIKSGRNYKGSK